MRANTYTTQIRVLLCQSCGAPLEVGAGGGHVACSYCHAQNQITSRRDDPSAIAPPSSMPVDEPERLRRLRMQDGQPMVPPPSLVPLLDASTGGFGAAKVEEAFHIYQATRREVLTTHSPEAAERLYFLTLIANTHLTRSGDDERRRAFLETSLDTLTLPRHVQVLRCLLATASAKEGDLASADQWLKPCNPRSDVIEADTAFRVARAFVETARGDFGKVLAVLGTIDDGYPIADAWDPTAAVLRANALERLGDLQGAVNALRTRMAKESHTGRATMERIVEAHPRLMLCAQSLPLAVQSHSQHAAKSVGRGVDGGIGLTFLVVGVAVILLGVVLMIGIAGPLVLAQMAAGGSLFEALLEGGFAGFIVFVTTVPLGGIFGGIGFVMYRKAKQAAWLRVHGIPAQGTVRGHRGTGVSINNVPVVEVEVEVRHPNAAPYLASFRQLLSAELAPHLAAGATVPLRVHPEKPTEIILETS